jgi:branched-chain amino acid transport system substrate-binding protein
LVRAGALVAVLALVAAACGDDDDDDDAGGSDTTAPVTDTTGASETTAGDTGTTDTTAAPGDLLMPPSGPDLGPENVASGEPVKVGYFNDGTTASVDHGDDTIVANALVEYWNNHQGGVAGRPVELVYCSTETDPSLATDCGNQFVEEGVVAVVTGTSGFSGEAFAPVHAAGIPFFGGGVALPEMLTDGETTFIAVNGSAQSHGFPITVAREAGIGSVVSLVYGTPAAIDPMVAVDNAADAAGIEHESVPIRPDTADFLPQVSAADQSDPGLYNIIGDPVFCLRSLLALYELEFDGVIVTHDYCISADVFAPLPPDKVQELVVSATVAMGAEDDPDWQFYTAMMDEYASETPEVSGVRGWTYQTLFMALWSMQDIQGDVTTQSVADAANAFPSAHLPLGAGITYVCDGSKFDPAPAFCTNQILQTNLSPEGNFEGFEAVDVSVELDAIAAGMAAG